MGFRVAEYESCRWRVHRAPAGGRARRVLVPVTRRPRRLRPQRMREWAWQALPLGARTRSRRCRPSCVRAAAWLAVADAITRRSLSRERRRRCEEARAAARPSRSCSSTRRSWLRASERIAPRGRRRGLGKPGEMVGRWIESLPFEPTAGPAARRSTRSTGPRLGRADAAAADGRGRLGEDGGRRSTRCCGRSKRASRPC